MQVNLTLEQQKKEFQMTLSKFSHEIRNPIALIQSELQMLATSHPELSEDDDWYSIMENLEHIRDLLDDLSRYNNAERLSPVQTDIAALLRSIVCSFRPALDYLGISLKTDIPESLPLLSLDQTKIRQALLNLLRNAQEAVQPSQGVISVSAIQIPEGVCISICDNGCGITDEQLKEIFHPFITYKPSGTGLGLPVTKQIIEAHKGRLEVHSTSGLGTEFQVFLRG